MTTQLQARMWAPVADGAPEWLTLGFVLIAIGVILVLALLAWILRLAKRRGESEHDVQAPQQPLVQEPLPAPPLTRAPPPLAEPPLAPPVLTPVFTPAPEPEPATPAPLADEPIAAAAPLEASPASLAGDFPAPVPEPQPEIAPAPVAASDDLTMMKGVGPRLAALLNTVGIASFAQIAALTPGEAEALDVKLGDFQGRIHRDRWIEQATFLAAGDIAGYQEKFGKL